MSIRPNYAELDATKTPSQFDIAWAAGVYEGEGHVRLCGKTKRGLALAVVQKDPEILIRLRDWFGGSININGKSEHQCHVWDACGDRARIFLALIYSYLSARRKVQVDLTGALEFVAGIPTDGLSIEDLKNHLAVFNEEKKRTTYRGKDGNATRRAAYARKKIASITKIA